MKRIAVFVSGEGTNFQALLNAHKAGRLGGEIALLVSSRAGAGAVARAKKAGVRTEIVTLRDFAGSAGMDAKLCALCRENKIDLVCLAGYMLKLGPKLLKAYSGAILNVHPALLPAFGGKGMYGMHVHRAVLESGAKISGCTVHFVTSDYDSGPVALQETVPVLDGDTPETLAARVLAREHQIFPKAVALFCAGRLKLKGSRVETLPEKIEPGKVKRALLSVSDKTGLAEFAKGLSDIGVELVSTSGTAKFLAEAGVPVRPLETLTGFPEILGGRVKTLHPMVHGGILLRRSDPAQIAEAARFGLEPIDMLVVNLYPFSRTLAKHKSAFEPEVIEDIDIGGVALIRAGSKNHEDVAVLTEPADYPAALEELRANAGALSSATRRRLAVKGFAHTAAYDGAIAAGLATAESGGEFPEAVTIPLRRVQAMRYGENPHQKAALYSSDGKPSFEQLHGKELSFNNILDSAGSWDAVLDFQEPAVVIFKHVTPCGAAVGSTLEEAFERARDCDPLSAFGGEIAVNRKVTPKLAEMISSFFAEIVTAPDFDPEALKILAQKKNIRLLRRDPAQKRALVIRSAGSEVLLSEPDAQISGGEWKIAAKRTPSPEELRALKFAWTACKHVRSNAIVLADEYQTVGIGAGQMSRVDAVKLAGMKLSQYMERKPKPQTLVMASDAFFPFRDSVDEAAKLGVTAIVQPGGSQRDAESIQAADERGIALLFTGMRHFRH